MKKTLSLLFVTAFLFSCSNSDDTTPNPDEKYLDGFYVSNEGNFGRGGASSSFISADLNTITNDIFNKSNGRELGDVSQSMLVTDKYVYIVVNNSNTIEVVNKKTFKSVYTITEKLNLPRYAVIKNNKLYVTSMNDAAVNVYNAENFSFIKTIALNHPSEKIVVANNYIYVANLNYKGGRSVEIIDPATDTNTVDIPFENAINGIATNGQFVYVLDANPTSSKISAINNTSITTSIAISQPSARNIVSDGSNIYYTANVGIYKTSNSLATEGTKLFDVADGGANFTLYGFNVIDGIIFTSDPNSFKDNSTIIIYKEDGSIIKEFTAGIGTNGFYKF